MRVKAVIVKIKSVGLWESCSPLAQLLMRILSVRLKESQVTGCEE